MKVYILILLVLPFQCLIHTQNMTEFLKTFFTEENRNLEFQKLRKILSEYDKMSEIDQKNFIKELENSDKDIKLMKFLIENRIFLEKISLKQFLKIIPGFFFNKNNTISMKERYLKKEKTYLFILNKSDKLNIEFEKLIIELEEEYLFEDFKNLHKEEIYSENSMKEKMEFLESIMNLNEGKNLTENQLKNEYFKKTNNTKLGENYQNEFYYFVNNKKVKKVPFIKEHHRKKFKILFDNFIEEKIDKKNNDNIINLNKTIEKHKKHFEKAKKKHINNINKKNKNQDKKTNKSNSSIFHLNQEEIQIKNHHQTLLQRFDDLVNITENLESILNETHPEFFQTKENANLVLTIIETLKLHHNHTKFYDENKFNNLKNLETVLQNPQKSKNISFLQMKQNIQTFNNAIESENSNDEDPSDCLSKEQEKKIEKAMDSLSSFAEDQSEAAEAPLKKEMTKYGKSSAENLMKIKSIIENIMMIVRGIVAIITGFFRICIPPAILAIFSCPEAAFFLDNLATLLQFSEKTEDYMQKIEAYPTFYNNMGVKKSKFGYYLCAQAVFTSECSALWPRCQELSFLFTQPPFTVVFFLMMFPILDWLQILPGDNPPCFLCCIQVLLQCSGIKFSEIPQCGGLYNIDTLLRALFDPALLIYLGFSFVPGLCNYVPFFINMWMIPPPLMTEEEKMMRKAPSLKKLIDSAKNDPEMTKFDTPCNTENKTKEKESQPFAEGISNDIINQIKNENDVRNQNDIIEDRNFGDFSDENEKIGLESQDFPAKYVEGEYEVGHWEKKLTPKSSDLIHKKIIEGRINSQKNKNSEEELNEAIKQDIEHYDNKANINQKIKNRVETLEMNSESHETQPKKINIGTNKATFSGEIGDIYWDYPVEKD